MQIVMSTIDHKVSCSFFGIIELYMWIHGVGKREELTESSMGYISLSLNFLLFLFKSCFCLLNIYILRILSCLIKFFKLVS